MTFVLPALFHWSPAERRAALFAEGLRPGSPSCVASCSHLPYVCLGFTPSGAWALSGGFRDGEVEEWDLWQVRVPARAEVHVRPEFGDELQEVKVYTPIPADRLWWVGCRADTGPVPLATG